MKMWSLQTSLIIFCTLLSCVTAEVLVGYEGKDVNVSCTYRAGYENHEKYLCKNGCHHNGDIVIKTKDKTKGKYSIYDDRKRRNFTVTITQLTPKDAGKYSCWVTTFWKDARTADFKLEVAAPPQQASTVKPVITITSQSTHDPGNPIKEDSFVYMVILIVPAVLLIPVVILLVVFRCRVKGPEVNMNRNISNSDAREMTAVTSMSGNKGVACSDVSSSKRRNKLQHNSAGEEQQESVYQNATMTESIYCNL